MGNFDMKYSKLIKLDKQINELREILNDICCTLDENHGKKEKLIISKLLDELIVEYMNQIYENI